MAVRQYIGARYVPKFSDVNNGVWDSTHSYEPLTIVKYGNDYYTSKKDVPVGVAITNDSYWVKTGDYNGAIAAVNARVDDVQAQIDRLEKRKFIFIGDSYQYGGGITGTGNRWAQGWLGLLTRYLGLTENVDFFHNEYPGYGFTTASSFLTLLQDLSASIADKNAITDIIVTGGLNDTTGASALDTTIRAFANYVKANYPNAKLHIGYIGNYFCNPQLRFNGRDVAASYRVYGQRNGASYISNSEYMLHETNYYSADETWHPNEAGHRSIAQHMVNYVIDGSFDVEENYRGLTFTLDSNLSYRPGSKSIYLTKDISNGITHIKNQNLCIVTIANGIEVSANARILLGVVDANGSNPALGSYSCVGIPCTIGDYDGSQFQYRYWNTSITYEYDSASDERRLYLNFGNTQAMNVYNIWIPPFDMVYSTNLS